jgi:hypothetical protein
LIGRLAEAACEAPASLCEHPVEGGVTLVDGGRPAMIYVDPKDHAGVLRAVRDLSADLGHVSGAEAAVIDRSETPPPQGGALIIVGTLGHSAVIDRLVRERKLDVTAVAGEWEAFAHQVVEQPFPGIARAFVIAGADKRGTIFGIYELSSRLGVSPWTWWADVPVARRERVYAAPGRLVDKPAVRYRGIFLNDEDPALGGWAKATFGGLNHRFYEHVFELVLRLKGNLLWPAMWGKAIYDDDPLSPQLADEMGVVLGTSHHEPMMRAHVEWERYGSGPWDYTLNADRLQQFWRQGIERMSHNESIVTIGMRGDGDKPMTEGTAVPLLERIVAEQRTLIEAVTGQPAARTPQVWALYKEVQDYYDRGMQVPPDVTLLFSDDNWGNLRRLPPRDTARAGGYGIYYHFDYVGGPRSYKWLNTNQIERTWEQMHLAYEYGADRIWIVNVGDLKPMEFPTSFFLDYAWNPRAWPAERLREYPAQWAAQQFGAAHSAEIGAFLRRYSQYNARRKPELLAPDTYSLVDFREAERVVSDYDALAAEAVRIGGLLPGVYRDAYFELVQFPIQICANLNELYYTVGRNRLYAAQGRAVTNRLAAEAQRLFDRDAELTRQYHELAGGRWNHMMSQTHISYTGWHDPERDVMPEVVRLNVPASAGLGVAVEGDAHAWPGAGAPPVLPELTPYSAPSRYVDVFDRGSAPLRFSVRSSQPWLQVSQTKAHTTDQARIEVSVDWQAAPQGEHQVPIVIRGAGSSVTVMAHVFKPAANVTPAGYVEADGYAAIEAAHFSRAVSAGGVSWTQIYGMGRTESAITAFPVTAPVQTPGGASPRLDYSVWLFQPGMVSVQVTVAPTLDFTGGHGLHYAVSLDGEPPQVVDINEDEATAWSSWVADNANVQTTRHRVTAAGAHTVTIWPVDPGVAFERVVVATRELPRSYLGPPESAHVP